MAKNYEDEEWEDEEVEEEEDEEVDIVKILKEEIHALTKEKKKYSPLSNEYMVLTQRISDATEQLSNAEAADNEHAQKECALRNKNTALLQTFGTVVGNIAGSTIGALINRSNVKTVVGYENDGGIVNSKAMKYTH